MPATDLGDVVGGNVACCPQERREVERLDVGGRRRPAVHQFEAGVDYIESGIRERDGPLGTAKRVVGDE